MNIEDFNTNLAYIHGRIDNVLAAKGDEYAGEIDKDRLHNFKVAAGMQGVTYKEALAGMMAKHTTSIYDMIADGRDYSLEKWDEKILDHINYLILLRALVVEEKDKALSAVLDVNTLTPSAVDPKTAREYLEMDRDRLIRSASYGKESKTDA